MTDDDKVIPLDSRRERRKDAGEKGKADDGPVQGRQGADQPLPGRLIWLYCPTCRTLEYTELPMGGGRVHNACGTQVEEAEVELDLRAEYTIAGINLERLRILEELLEGQRTRYEEYRKRLTLAAGKNLEPYASPEQALSGAGSEEAPPEVDAFGLIISQFFRKPVTLFPSLGDPEGSPDSDPDTDPS